MSLIQSVELLLKSAITFHLVLIKLLAILVIFYGLAHQNNNNYFLFLVAIYLCLAKVKVDAIILLNDLYFLVLYNIILKRLKNIMSSSAIFIK